MHVINDLNVTKTVLNIIYIDEHTFNILSSNSIYFFFLHLCKQLTHSIGEGHKVCHQFFTKHKVVITFSHNQLRG